MTSIAEWRPLTSDLQGVISFTPPDLSGSNKMEVSIVTSDPDFAHSPSTYGGSSILDGGKYKLRYKVTVPVEYLNKCLTSPCSGPEDNVFSKIFEVDIVDECHNDEMVTTQTINDFDYFIDSGVTSKTHAWT